LLDDHPLYVEGLKNLLQEDFEIVSAVSTGLEAVEEAGRTKPDVILMDVNMPGLRWYCRHSGDLSKQPEIKILMLTSFGETDTVVPGCAGRGGGILAQGSGGYGNHLGTEGAGEGQKPLFPRPGKPGFAGISSSS
jgi:DNA-binding NarL/FixJ family response regulator